jgi:hypothetical protein
MKVLRHENFWKFLIIVAIGLAAGPEIVLAIEMRILLELLGVALFTTALVVGGELVLLQLRTWLLDMVMPPAHLALLRSDARIPEKVFSTAHFASYGPWWLELVALFACALVLALKHAA